MLAEHGGNFNDEARMTNDERNPNAQMIESAIGAFYRQSGFRHSSFVIENKCFATIFR